VRSSAAIVATILLIACREEGAPLSRPASAPSTTSVSRNVLDFGLGAAVVSRTGELTLESSALRAIDGDPLSAWASPTNDTQQTLVFSLPAPASIEKIGIRTSPAPHSRTIAMTVEASSDGTQFSQLANLRLEHTDQPQWFDAPFADARYVRVLVTEGGSQMATLQSVELEGEWRGQRSTPPIEDCWTINQAPASFAEREGRIAGSIGDDNPIQFDGGRKDAVYRFAWARGGSWGYGLVTLTPDGKHLSGLRWFQDAAVHSYGGGWYGERRPCQTSGMQPDRVVDTFLGSAGWYPLYSLHFNEHDQLDEAASRGGLQVIANVMRRIGNKRMTLIAREYDGSTREANQRRTDTRLASLRDVLTRTGADLSQIDFVSAGSTNPRRPTDTAAMRQLYGVVEIDITGTVRSGF
jgi:hypothetical protein